MQPIFKLGRVILQPVGDRVWVGFWDNCCSRLGNELGLGFGVCIVCNCGNRLKLATTIDPQPEKFGHNPNSWGSLAGWALLGISSE